MVERVQEPGQPGKTYESPVPNKLERKERGDTLGAILRFVEAGAKEFSHNDSKALEASTGSKKITARKNVSMLAKYENSAEHQREKRSSQTDSGSFEQDLSVVYARHVRTAVENYISCLEDDATKAGPTA